MMLLWKSETEMTTMMEYWLWMTNWKGCSGVDQEDSVGARAGKSPAHWHSSQINLICLSRKNTDKSMHWQLSSGISSKTPIKLNCWKLWIQQVSTGCVNFFMLRQEPSQTDCSICNLHPNIYLFTQLNTTVSQQSHGIARTVPLQLKATHITQLNLWNSHNLCN